MILKNDAKVNEEKRGIYNLIPFAKNKLEAGNKMLAAHSAVNSN